MKIALTLLSLLIGVSAASADIDCSNAQQTIGYKSIGYNLGVPPRRGDTLSQEKIFLGGTLVSHTIFYNGLNPQLGPVEAEFDYNTRIELEDQSTSGGRLKIYAIKLTLKNRFVGNGLVGNDTATLPEDIESYVICRDAMFYIP